MKRADGARSQTLPQNERQFRKLGILMKVKGFVIDNYEKNRKYMKIA